MISLFPSSKRACLTGSLRWKGTGTRLCLALGTALSLRRIWAAGPDTGENFPLFLNAVSANCSKSQFLSLWMFCSVGGKGSFLGHIGSCSSTLLCLGLASDFLYVLVKCMYCFAISAMGGIVAVGFWKSLGCIPMSMHTALLKYRHLIFWHMYTACLVVFPWTMNSMGSQPYHECKASYTQTTCLDGMRLFIVSPIFRRCLSPPRHMVAPLSRKIIILVLLAMGISLACLGSGFGENETIYVSISLIWPVSLNVYVPVAWLNVMWAMSVFFWPLEAFS